MPLRPDQIEDLGQIVTNKRFINGNDPGAGKTPTCCVYQRWLWDEHGIGSIWVMPKSLLKKNRDEAYKFGLWENSDDVVIVDGTPNEVLALLKKPARVWIMGFARFAQVWPLLPDYVKAMQVDEFHKGFGGHTSGQTQPAERKRMVDQVIGVDRLDELTKWCAEQQSLLGREIDVLTRSMGEEPVAPEKPDGYHCSSSLRFQLDHRRGLKQELDQLTGWLSHVRAAPVCPHNPHLPVMDREAELREIDEVEAKRKHLQSLPVIDFDPEEVRKAWDAYDKWEIYDVWKAHNPRPRLSRDEVNAGLGLEEKRIRHAELSAQLTRLEKSPKVTCPKCASNFHLAHTELDHVRNELAALGDIPPRDHTQLELREELRRLDNWDRLEVQEMARTLHCEGLKPPKSVITRKQLADAPLGITAADLAEQLAALPKLRTRSVVVQEIEALRRYELAFQTWAQEEDDYAIWLAERQEKQVRADELKPSVAELPALEQALQRSVAYENAQQVFEKAHARWSEQSEELKTKEAERDGWRDARRFIAEVRTRIKTYLVPSLSAVASHLISQMTGGQRTSIVVDQEFEITVDGQPLGTLSGSGKACANLALRIGLGQVLTHNVLSLFIGDEIDASMDEDRAENTHISLQRLTDKISQIFLISHKCPEADFTIALAPTITYSGSQGCTDW